MRSVEQAFLDLQEAVRLQTSAKVPVGREENLIFWASEHWDAELEASFLLRPLATRVRCPEFEHWLDDEWYRWSHEHPEDTSYLLWNHKRAHLFTFQAAAEFIAAHDRPQPLQPVSLLGHTCRKAGAFRLVQRMTWRRTCEAIRFAPSTPIRERVDAWTLKKLWADLQPRCERRLPELRRTWVDRSIEERNPLTLLADVLGLGWSVYLMFSGGGWLAAAGTTLALAICWRMFRYHAYRRQDVLPPEIRTFGDLARQVSALHA